MKKERKFKTIDDPRLENLWDVFLSLNGVDVNCIVKAKTKEEALKIARENLDMDEDAWPLTDQYALEDLNETFTTKGYLDTELAEVIKDKRYVYEYGGGT